MDTCIFCKIASGTVPASILYSDDEVIAFKDINPVAPTHILIIPRQHIDSINQVDENHDHLLGHMINVARQLANQQKVNHSGYRLVFNTGPDAGQSVFHVHLHLLGGRKMPFRFDE